LEPPEPCLQPFGDYGLGVLAKMDVNAEFGIDASLANYAAKIGL